MKTNEEMALELMPTKNGYGEITDALLNMAQWKDEQFAKEKQELIDKVCGLMNVFLNTHYIMRYKDNCEPDKSWIIEVFKRVMK